MKKILFVMILLPIIVFGQKKKYEITKDQRQQMVNSVPLKDDKIIYDEVVSVDSTLNKESLFIKIRQWFVENFSDSKSVLEVNDPDNGLLTGKGTYRYNKINGLNYHKGFTTFVMNVAVKGGKFRYQLYNFNAEGTNTSMLAQQNAYNNSTRAEKVSLDEMANWYKQGKREKLARKYLEDMVDLVYYIQNSLNDLSKQTTSITDF